MTAFGSDDGRCNGTMEECWQTKKDRAMPDPALVPFSERLVLLLEPSPDAKEPDQARTEEPNGGGDGNGASG
jgi:hypothetical protein